MGVVKKIATQTAIYGLTSIIGRILNFLLTPLYTSMFLVEQYAIITDIYSQISIFIVLLTYGMETAFFRFCSQTKNKKKVTSTAFFSILGSSFIFLVLGLLFLDEISTITGYTQNKDFIRWVIYILFLDAILAIPFAQLRLNNKPIKYAIVKLTNIFIFIGGNLLFLWYIPKSIINGWYLPSFLQDIYNADMGVGYIFIINLVASLASLLMMFPVFGKYKPAFYFTTWKKMLRYGFPILIAGLANVINETMDKQFLKYLLPQKDWKYTVGVYGACYKLSIFMILFIQAYRMGIEPFFFSYAKEKNAKETYSMLMNYFVIVMCFILLILVSSIDIIKYFLSSKTYWQGVDVVPILLLANLFFGIYVHLSVWYKLSDKTKYGAYISILGAFITIIININFIPMIGYKASAWATLASYFSMCMLSFLWGRKHYYIPYHLKKIGFYITLSVGLSCISFFVYRGDITVNIFLNLIFLLVIALGEKESFMKLVSTKKH